MPASLVIHVLLYGREMSLARFNLWKKNSAAAATAHATTATDAKSGESLACLVTKFEAPSGDVGATSSEMRLHESESSTPSVDVLVIHRKFASFTVTSTIPDVVRDAACHALKLGWTIRTEDWLGWYIRNMNFESGGIPYAPGLWRGGDVTECMRERLGQLKGVDLNAEKGGGSCGGASLRREGSGINAHDAINLESTDSSDDDEVVIVLRTKCPPPAARKKSGSYDPNPTDGETNAAGVDDETRQNRIRNRTVRRLMPFHASWLRGLRGDQEAKAKARPSSQVDGHDGVSPSFGRKRKVPSSGFVTQVTKGGVYSPEGKDGALVEERLVGRPNDHVHYRATQFLQRRQERGGNWKYAFEQCYHRVLESKKRNDGKENDVSVLVRKDQSKPLDGKQKEEVDAHMVQMMEGNKTIANRLRKLVAAETALRELRELGPFASINAGRDLNDRDVDDGRRSDAEKKNKLKMQDQQHRFRELSYERVARIVETYPIPVTVDCLTESDDTSRRGRGIQRGEGSGRNLGSELLLSLNPFASNSSSSVHGRHRRMGSAAPRPIKAGGSIRGRLVRSILCMDDNPLLHGDLNHKMDVDLLNNADLIAINELRNIWGVGTRTAARLVSWGICNIEQLRSDPEVMAQLNRQQLVGVSRYEDIMERIPREEVAEIRDHVFKTVKALSGDTVTVTACGSYRRGKTSCGDVDLILLPKKDWSYRDANGAVQHGAAPDDAAVKVMPSVLDALRAEGFLTDDLTVPNMFGENEGPNPGTDSLSYMGVCRLPPLPTSQTDGVIRRRKHRRVDIKAYPGCQGAFALLYFTGDAHFNRSLRAFAKRARLTLSDAGLACCERERGFNGKKRKVYESAVCDSEEDIFATLGVGNVPPSYRSCFRAIRTLGSDKKKRWDVAMSDSDESDSDE